MLNLGGWGIWGQGFNFIFLFWVNFGVLAENGV